MSLSPYDETLKLAELARTFGKRIPCVIRQADLVADLLLAMWCDETCRKLTREEIIAWNEAHPGERPLGLDVTTMGDWEATLPQNEAAFAIYRIALDLRKSETIASDPIIPICDALERMAELLPHPAQVMPESSAPAASDGRISHAEAANMLLLGDRDPYRTMKRLRQRYGPSLNPEKCGNFYTYDRAAWAMLVKAITSKSRLKTSHCDGVETALDDHTAIQRRIAEERAKKQLANR